jgi:hypothetical protein
VIAKPASAIQRMEASQCDRLAVANIMEPRGVLKRGPPRWLEKIEHDVDPGSHGSGVIEPRSESSKQVGRNSGRLGVFWHRRATKAASHNRVRKVIRIRTYQCHDPRVAWGGARGVPGEHPDANDAAVRGRSAGVAFHRCQWACAMQATVACVVVLSSGRPCWPRRKGEHEAAAAHAASAVLPRWSG